MRHGNVLAEACVVDDWSSIFAAHPYLERLDGRTAMRLLGRGVTHRSTTSRDSARRWFVLWPAIPVPVLYAHPEHAYATQARAA
jgi:hypothetical protein